MKEKVTSVKTLIELIKKYKTTIDNNLKETYYRGQVADYGEIEPSIARDKYLESEDIMFKEFILRNPSDFNGLKTTFEKLAKMQHYSLPTRLLDISSNPLISLFFAVEEKGNDDDDKDGVFIFYHIPKTHVKYYDSDTVSVVSNVSRRPHNSLDIKTLPNDVPGFNDNKAIHYLLHEIKEEKPYFQDLIKKEHLQSIWCVKPLMDNRRIIKQDGAFLLFGIGDNKNKLAKYDTRNFEPLKHIIPKLSKQEIREELELLGITRDKIYPELDTTAQFLKEKYK
ncbi:FRG domain-containing protein [Polaribacter sp. Z014]|uniref:FRG domain-containing protein n=1 Tax=Polaribacter sp. Z014 TaxID=2927126 RepID=UPI0020215232|nr:FRG domain-containing protein [Polaribacter sp. Z014]MCL7765480.1 FRG domain-containing protein [Polaribacter sp. Z014]